MKLIDADAIDEHVCHCLGIKSSQFYTEQEQKVIEYIKEMPEGIVRCKDCKYKYLRNQVWVCPFMTIPKPDGFCSYGEKEVDTRWSDEDERGDRMAERMRDNNVTDKAGCASSLAKDACEYYGNYDDSWLYGSENTEPDQTAKSDAGKLQLHLVPPTIIEAIARVREYGTAKYGSDENWKRVEKYRYRDAAYRHWLAYMRDSKSLDEESGYPHIFHVACNIAFLIEQEYGDGKI